MATTQNYVTDLQSQALQAIKSGQAAALEAVQTWRDSVAKLAPAFPAYDPRDVVGDPVAIVDSVYDFAKELLELNKAFARQILEASQSVAPVAEAV